MSHSKQDITHTVVSKSKSNILQILNCYMLKYVWAFSDLSTSNFSKEGDCLRLRGRFEAREGALEEDFSPKREHFSIVFSSFRRKIGR